MMKLRCSARVLTIAITTVLLAGVAALATHSSFLPASRNDWRKPVGSGPAVPSATPREKFLTPAELVMSGWNVTSVSPLRNALNVSRTSNVAATFNDTVSQLTVSSSTFTLRGLYTGRYDGAYTFPTTNSAQIDPTLAFKPGEVITATASSRIQNTNGDPLTPYTWQFWAAATGGSASFLPHTTTPQFGAEDSGGIALGDLDGDGDLDAVVANGGFSDSVNFRSKTGDSLVVCGSNAETVWLNNGSATFTPHPATNCFGGNDSRDVTLGDLDGDGDLDAVVANWSGQPETVWLNDGAGNFTAHGTTPSFGGQNSTAVSLGDLDGDGDLDAVIANAGDESETVWLNDGAGNFSAHPTPSFDCEDSQDVALGDLDADGDLDAVVVNILPFEGNSVWLNDGTGVFTRHTLTPYFGAGTGTGVALGDVDADGDLDSVVSNANNEPETVWVNDGAGNFSAHSSPSFGADESLDVTLGDIDGDGDLDAVVANRNADLVVPGVRATKQSALAGPLGNSETVWRNNGTGVFTAHPSRPYFGEGLSNAVVLGDLDGDGDLDAVVANEGGPPPDVDPAASQVKYQSSANGTEDSQETVWINEADGDGIPDNCPPPIPGDDGGVTPSCDNCPILANPGQEDADADNVGDVCDNCPDLANTGQEDGDEDGVGNVCDNCLNLANTGQEDGDQDGVGNVCDNCPATSNSGQEDGDGDGVGNVCDNCPAASNSDQEDQDQDGRGDVCDNCPTIPNTEQTDLNQNGIGDICERADLTITKTHSGNFTPGQSGSYTITVTNSGSGNTDGSIVTVTDVVPTGLTPTGPSGLVNGWNCSINGQTLTCTRTDSLTSGASYPAIILTVNVANPAPLTVTNTATVSGGGDSDPTNNTATDVTNINCEADASLTNNNPLVISRFRMNGPQGSQDEFVELFNPTDEEYTVASGNCTGGLAVFASAGNGTTSNGVNMVCQIPNGTQIPARGYFLCTGATYSLNNLGLNGGLGGANATGDAAIGCGGSCTNDIPNDSGLALIDVASNIITMCPKGAFGCPTGFSFSSPGTSGSAKVYDSIGFSAYGPGAPASERPSLASNFCEGDCLKPVGDASTAAACTENSSFPVTAAAPACYGQAGQYEFLRRQTTFDANLGTLHQDTNHNVNDILLVAPNAATNMGLQVTGVSGVTAVLGASVPQNSNAPVDIPRTEFTQAPFDAGDQLGPRNAERNYTLDPTIANTANDPLGTFTLRLRYTNNSGRPVTPMRYRVDNLATLCGPQNAAPVVGTGNARNLSAAPDCGAGGFTAILKVLNSTQENVVDSGGTQQFVFGTVLEDLSVGQPSAPGPLSPLGGGVDNTVVPNPSSNNASVGDGVTGGIGQYNTNAISSPPVNVIRLRIKFGVVKSGRFILLLTPQAKFGPTPFADLRTVDKPGH